MEEFTELQASLLDSLQRVVDKEIAPLAQEMDETETFPRHLISVFGELGLMQARVPEEYGGPGLDLTTTCMAKELVAKVSMTGAQLINQNTISFVLPLLHFGTEEQRRKWLPLVARGGVVSSVAMTEPHAGSDIGAMRTCAVRDGDHYVVNGQKCFITMAPLADYITLFAKTGDIGRRGVDNISCFIVDMKSPGITLGKSEKMMGQRGTPHADIYFDQVRVPVENRMGEEGKGFLSCMHILDLNRPTVAASAVGVAQGAFDIAVAYAKERKAFGKSIGEFQGIQFMLADMHIQIEAARALLYKCTRAIDAGRTERLTEMASMVKCFCTDTAMKVTTDAVQILGGHGYVRGNHVERMMRDAKVLQIYEGTNQIQRMVVARRALGLR
ncbi:acyl-CoA dehydrogenase [Variovorax sp. WS11]|uniref:acyl-CoA dehydrogenase family protein n=1 Tax=Variovorax sp. WS11 TaxID=1105204 RepID=UPI000D0D21FC|nr:acyl-CoA dehydrogenase family protein [Variovorax sp. WS11]NDZ18554.1 acyl-CoA dehydrogenase [Variovorax sp. WS11]PSL85185.1 acyl-CoA dehydrogenase [Variovorax sp. WS11]